MLKLTSTKNARDDVRDGAQLSALGRVLRGIPIGSYLFQAYRYSSDCKRHLSADLWALQLQNDSIRVLQLNASSTNRNGASASYSAVNAFDRSRPSD